MEEAALLARFTRKPSLTLVGAVALVIALANPAAAPPGDLDTTFDGDGKVTTDFGAVNSANAVAIQGDGKIVAAGCTGGSYCDYGDRFALARHNTDGSLDTTFDGDGKVTTRFASLSQANAVAIQGDGKIVAAGLNCCPGVFPNDGAVFALARYNIDGSLDTTFDGDGKVSTDVAGEAACCDQANGVAIQGDGKIVAAGVTRNGDFALARYNTDGSLDTTFDGDGLVRTDFAAGTDVAHGVAIQANGKIVAAGVTVVSGNFDFALARYNTDGTSDLTFGVAGKVITDFARDNDGANGVAIQGDGKIVAAGCSGGFNACFGGSSDFALARYNTDGSLDTTFGGDPPFPVLGDGMVTTDFAGDNDGANGVAIQGDGKIVAAGSAVVSGNDFALARHNTDGSLDTTFGGDGKVTTDFAGDNDGANGVAIQGDGKIVAAGVTVVSGNVDFALARYRIQDAADLAITKIADKQRAATGRDLTYTLTVTNIGPDPASGVIVTDTLPPTATFVSATPPCVHSAGIVTCNLGTIGSGGFVTLQIVVRPNPPPGLITNTASVTASTDDPVGANNSASVTTETCRVTTRPTTRPCS